jgi:hypothetical protein
MAAAKLIREVINRLSSGLLTFTAAAALTSMVVSIYVSMRLAFDPSLARPATEYSQEMYYPDQIEYCPGEVLHVEYTATIHRPGVNQIVDTIWSASSERTVVFDHEPRYSINRTKRSIQTNVEYEIPDLPTGLYELRHASFQESSRPAVWSAPFVIPERCFEN